MLVIVLAVTFFGSTRTRLDADYYDRGTWVAKIHPPGEEVCSAGGTLVKVNVSYFGRRWSP